MLLSNDLVIKSARDCRCTKSGGPFLILLLNVGVIGIVRVEFQNPRFIMDPCVNPCNCEDGRKQQSCDCDFIVLIFHFFYFFSHS